MLPADFAREKSCWRHKVAQGPRAKLWSPNLRVSGGQVWEMHGQTTPALDKEACQAQRFTCPHKVQRP